MERAEMPQLPREMPLAATKPADYWRSVRKLYRSSGAVILGNVLEWYDWTVFGYMQDILKDVFGSGSAEKAWMLFAVPFLARPLGSLVFGWIGDKCGRAVSLKLAIWGMALCTVLQGCLPTQGPGVLPVLAVLRVITGLSAGGESAGVNTYMSEIGDEGHEHTLGAAIGVNNLSGSLAFLLANLVSLLVHLLPREQQLAWAWRVPFLLALPLGVASVVLRRRMPETEAFRRKQASQQEASGLAPAPDSDLEFSFQETEEVSEEEEEEEEEEEDILNEQQKEVEKEGNVKGSKTTKRWAVWRAHLHLVPLVVLVLAAVNSCNYLPIYLVSWLEEEASLAPQVALSISALAKVTQMLMTFPASYATDRFGATKVMLLGGLAVSVAAVPLMWLVISTNSHGIAFGVLGVLMPVLVSLYLVPSNLFMTCVFPTSLRGRTCGLCLGLASICGGLTPMIATRLAKEGQLWPGAFISLLTVPSLAVLLWSRWAKASGRLAVYQRPWLF